MRTDNDMLLATLRAQAWERAKGELQAVLVTYYGGYEDDAPFKQLDPLVKAFVKEVEDRGLIE